MSKTIFFGLIFGWLFAVNAQSANIEVIQQPGSNRIFISITGEITKGDSSRFHKVAERHSSAMVILESPGGLVYEALSIGAEIVNKGFATMVTRNRSCYSSCALIWVSGKQRYMATTSTIGVHAAYRERYGRAEESGMANAEIGSYLTHLGLRREAIQYFTASGPGDFLLITPAAARALGIDVFVEDNGIVINPNQAPTADVFATRFLRFGFLHARCNGFFNADADFLKASQMAAIDAGMRIASSSDAWIDIWMPIGDELLAAAEARGDLIMCLDVERRLRSDGLPTGIDSPSFNCAKARSNTEYTICSDPSFWAKDRLMASAYFIIRRNSPPDVREAALSSQRDWIRRRNACRSESGCLHATYNSRIDQFQEIFKLGR